MSLLAAEDDDLVNETEMLMFAASGGDYDGVTAEVAVEITDTDKAALELSRTSLTLQEGGGSATFTVKLTNAPSASVTVALSDDGDSDLTVQGGSPLAVILSAAEDLDIFAETEVLTFAASGGDYDGGDCSRSAAGPGGDGQRRFGRDQDPG